MGHARGRRATTPSRSIQLRIAAVWLSALSAFLATTGASVASAQPTQAGQPQPNAATGAAVPGTSDATLHKASRVPRSSALEEVVVTAQKRKQSVYGVGIAITALSGAQLRQQGVTTVGQLTKVDPSFVLAQSSFGSPVYTIRGIGYNDFSLDASPTVSVYLDEVPYAFPVLSKGATLDAGQVEILKGPQGTLYGQNATGGAVNYLAARPTSSLQAGIEGTYGNFGASDLNGYISGALTPELLGRASFDIVEGGAYQKSDTRDETTGDKNLKKGRVILDWTPSQDLHVSLNLNGFTDNSDTLVAQETGLDLQNPQFASRIPRVLSSPLVDNNDQTADWLSGTKPHDDEGFFQGSLRADYTVSDQLVLTYLGTYENYQQNDFISDNGQNVPVDLLDDGSVLSTTQEVRGSGKLLDDKLDWLLGADFALTNTKENGLYDLSGESTSYAFTPFGYPQIQDVRAIAYDDSKTGAAFGNLEYHILDNLDVHAGARFNQTDITHSGCTQDVNGDTVGGTDLVEELLKRGVGVVPAQVNGCTTLGPNNTPQLIRQKLDENNAPWRVGVDWFPIKRTLLYATVSKGYKAGAFSNTPATSYIVLKPAKQEALLAYEAGFKSRLLDNRLELTGAYFHYDYRDKQLELRQPDPNGIFGLLNTLQNVPSSTEDGVELSGRFRPIDSLVLSASGTYLDTRVDGRFINYSPLSPTPINIGGEAFPDIPKWAARLGAQYDFDVTDRYAAYVGASFRYQSRSQGAFGTQNDLQQGLPSFEVRDYGIVDLRAGVNTSDGHWHLQVFGNNVTNTYYWNQVVRSGDVAVRFAGLPTMYGLTLGYQF